MTLPKQQSGGTKDYTILSSFGLGYRNREDKTNLPPGVLIEGSQNVVTNVFGRVQTVKGYTLDGQSSTVEAGILSWYDYEMNINRIQHLRCYLDPTTSKGILQYRFVRSTGAVTWKDLFITLNSAYLNFTEYWDATANQSKLLFVDGSSNIYVWTGGLTTFASATANTITKEGTTSWVEEGFDNLSATRKVLIKGVEYTYTGGEATTTLTGVTPDPTGAGISAGDSVVQTVITKANSGLTSLPAAFKNYLISVLKNQVYVGDLTKNAVYVSKVNDYTNYSFTSPVRVVGEGAILTLDAPIVAFRPQEESMYISAGQDYWYQTKFTLSSDLASESLTIERLKTGSKQGAKSQSLVSKDKNNVIFISNEPVLTSLGRVAGVITTPQLGDLSYPIINDFNAYDFTDGSVAYDRNFIYVCVPKEGLIRIYNQTNPSSIYWEAPITYPITGISIIDGELYGHSYNTPETLKLFTGYNFNGFPYKARAQFSYNNFGTRSKTKGINKMLSEGYIQANTMLTLGIIKEIDGNAIETSYKLDGSNRRFVAIPSNTASLGKSSLGKNSLGGSEITATNDSVPPKFRWIKTFPIEPYFFEETTYYESNGIDQQWELISFGPKLTICSDLNTNITE